MVCKVGPRPLNSGDPFAVQVSVGCALSTREQMFSRFAFCVQPFSLFGVQYLQLLISLRATIIAMMTIRITRTMSR